MQFLEFSCDLILKIILETYYKEGMVPEATGVQKKKKSKMKSYIMEMGYEGCNEISLGKVSASNRAT